MISRQHLKAHLITVYVNRRVFVLFHLKKQRIENQRRKKELTEDGKESYSKTTFSEQSLWIKIQGPDRPEYPRFIFEQKNSSQVVD